MAKRKMHGKKKTVKLTGKEPFKLQAKKPEPDDRPRPIRPAAHGQKEAARAKRITKLAHRMI
jgi:hypothetical protein